jgi:hypothetical protein
VPIRLVAVIALALLASACQKNIQTKEAVREALNQHLSKVSGLDLTKMEVEVLSLDFQKDDANTRVRITPKGMGSDQGMEINYALKREGDHWTVAKKAGGMGHGMAPPPPTGEMPSGHPPVDPKK